MAYPSPISHELAAEVSSPARAARERATTLGLAGLFLLLVVIVYAKPLFTRWNFGGRDLLAYNLPIEKAVHDAYARGRLPAWLPEVSGGRPLLPNPNAGALYPVRPLLALIPFPLAMRLFPVLHWALAGAGVLFLVRLLGASSAAAWVAAVSYTCSGVAVSEVFFPHILPGLALLPWVVWATARPSARWSDKLLLLSLPLGLDFLAADVFSIGMALSCATLWILLEEPRAAWGGAFLALGAAVLLAGLVAAPQIVATLLWIPETRRAVSGMTLDESLRYSIHPFRLLELVVPYPFGSTFAVDASEVWTSQVFHQRIPGLFSTLYAGAFPVVGAVAIWRKTLLGARFARVLALVTLALSVPPSLLSSGWSKLASPLPLRNPEKFAVALALALAILAGLAFDVLRRTRPRGLFAVALALCLFAVIAQTLPDTIGRLAAALIREPSVRALFAGRTLAVAFAEAGLLWIATLFALEALRLLPRAGLVVGLTLLTLVPIAANRRIALTFREDALFAPTPFARFQERADPQGQFRTIGASGYRSPSVLEESQGRTDPAQIEYSRRNWNQYTPVLWQRGTVFNQDFDSGDLSRLESLRRLSFVASGFRDAEAIFGALGLRWGIRFRDQEPLPGYRRFRGNALIDWDEHERAFPDIRLAEKWREESGAVAALNVLPRLTDGEIVVESESSTAGFARPGRLRVLEKSPERVRLETLTPDPTWLFVLRGHWSHRTVLLDGAVTEDVPAQLAFSAVRVPAGRHRIEWNEEVPGWSVSRFGPLLSVLTFLWIRQKSSRRSRGAGLRA
jgi:hypothetical protein